MNELEDKISNKQKWNMFSAITIHQRLIVVDVRTCWLLMDLLFKEYHCTYLLHVYYLLSNAKRVSKYFFYNLDLSTLNVEKSRIMYGNMCWSIQWHIFDFALRNNLMLTFFSDNFCKNLNKKSNFCHVLLKGKNESIRILKTVHVKDFEIRNRCCIILRMWQVNKSVTNRFFALCIPISIPKQSGKSRLERLFLEIHTEKKD